MLLQFVYNFLYFQVLPDLFYWIKICVNTLWVSTSYNRRCAITVKQPWHIIKVRSLTYKICQGCVTCKQLFAPNASQKMADLPEQRLVYDKLPFDHVSVDCFGPFSTKYRRSTCKRYGCVFTCHNIRAIYNEKLDDLSSDTFINACFVCFVCFLNVLT